MPESKGQVVTISCFVDANHAGNVITQRLLTGIIIYVQNTPIIWFSKRQNAVESSSLGSEYVALRAAKDMLVALQYKLQIFGVPIDGPANVFCDNSGVVKNTMIPQDCFQVLSVPCGPSVLRGVFVLSLGSRQPSPFILIYYLVR
jgi:hypothetical protein